MDDRQQRRDEMRRRLILSRDDPRWTARIEALVQRTGERALRRAEELGYEA